MIKLLHSDFTRKLSLQLNVKKPRFIWSSAQFQPVGLPLADQLEALSLVEP